MGNGSSREMVRIYCQTFNFPHSLQTLQGLIETGNLFQERPYDQNTRKGAIDYFFQQDTKIVLQEAPPKSVFENTDSGLMIKTMNENRSLVSLASLSRSRIELFSLACDSHHAYAYTKILTRTKKYLTKQSARRDL